MDRLELFHNLVNFAASDGRFTDEEVRFLATRAEMWNIARDEFETALAGLSTGQVQVKMPERHADKVELLQEMIRLMAIDGELADAERRLCALASARMDFTSTQFEEILDSVLDEAG